MLILALANQLRNRGQVVVVLGVGLSLFRVEEVITSDELKDHAGERPDVGTSVVVAIKDDFWRTVLSGLDYVRVVLVGVAGVAHVDKLDVEHHVTDLLEVFTILGLHLHEHSLGPGAVDLTLDAHAEIDFLALLLAQVLVFKVIPFSLVFKGLEIVGGVFLHELLVLTGRVHEPDMSIARVRLFQEFVFLILSVEAEAGFRAAFDRESMVCFKCLLFDLDLILHLLLDLGGF